MTATAVRACTVFAGLAVAAPAHAHLVETGFGAYYDGIVHLVATPADLLLLVALALLAGQRGAQAARWALFVLPAAWLVGGALSVWAAPAAPPPLLMTTLTFGIVGAWVALGGAGLSAGAVALLAAVAGLLHGFAGGAVPQPSAALALVGAATAAFCLFAMVAAQATTIRAAWARIALRVGGSWLAAAALLMLGWLARAR